MNVNQRCQVHLDFWRDTDTSCFGWKQVISRSSPYIHGALGGRSSASPELCNRCKCCRKCLQTWQSTLLQAKSATESYCSACTTLSSEISSIIQVDMTSERDIGFRRIAPGGICLELSPPKSGAKRSVPVASRRFSPDFEGCARPQRTPASRHRSSFHVTCNDMSEMHRELDTLRHPFDAMERLLHTLNSLASYTHSHRWSPRHVSCLRSLSGRVCGCNRK